MKNKAKNIIVLFLGISLNIFTSVKAQQVNTLYFMENVPVRHYLNPAFQPLSNFYLGFPVFGYTQFGIGNNSFTMKDFLITDASGKTIINPNKDKFFNAIRPTTLLKADMQINLLDFGFRTGDSYWSFSLTEKVDGQFGVPKDFFKLLLYGMPELENNVYDFRTLGLDMTAYTEAALGYSTNINDRWSVGGKLKFLYGTANISTANQNIDFTTGIDEWILKGKGAFNVAVPGELEIGNNLDSFNYIQPSTIADWVKPTGIGAAIDLGFTFKPISALTLSAAITDLGMIRWNRNVNNVSYNVDYMFDGAGSIDMNTDFDNFTNSLPDSIIDNLKKSVTTSKTNNAYTSRTSPKINIGAEYGFFDNKLSVGLLSRTILQNKQLYEELTASLNGRPIDWFNLSLSYSVLNGRMSNIGAGIGLRTGFLNWFMTADYVPLQYAGIPVNFAVPVVNIQIDKIPVPYNTKGMNFAVGVNFVFGNRRDSDKDGVVDRKDKCPETPFSVIVDKKGCPLDTDGDGVPDYLDKCPGTPPEAYNRIDEHGCPVDADGDGVPDYLDKCPDTPKEAIGFVDQNGCELDSDKDGVFDYLDKCPDTPEGVKVDADGCPFDTDGDGVADYLDLCPDTPAEARGKVDKNGCPLDSDLDGVADYVDLCPNTPLEARGFVDKNGCPLDKDDDGVADYLDKCPDTPSEARGMVDEKGCPRDTDGDGIPDYLDNCPKVPGVAANKGCPEIKKEVRTLFQKALQGIQFETGKFVIKSVSYKILNQIAEVLIANPTYLIEVRGHTDNVGKPDANLILSEKRAEAVRLYLIGKGVAEKRMTSHGFGDTLPVATNKTAAGRALNRRVEFVVTFEEITFE